MTNLRQRTTSGTTAQVCYIRQRVSALASFSVGSNHAIRLRCLASQTGTPTTRSEPVVTSVASLIATGDNDRQAIALQSVTLTVNPVNISPGDSTANTVGVSPNTNPTEIAQPLIATEGGDRSRVYWASD